jgi:hypothetical protein
MFSQGWPLSSRRLRWSNAFPRAERLALLHITAISACKAFATSKRSAGGDRPVVIRLGRNVCTHPSNASVDLSTTLVALGKISGPPKEPIFVPTPNHDHVVDDNFVTTGQIWREVRPVLVMDPSDWPAADGSSGITSSEKMDAVEAAGRAIEVGSNFFLFFSSALASH